MPEAREEHEHQKLVREALDEQLETDGLLDPDQPTESSHRKWMERQFGEFRPGEFTPVERAMIRAQYRPEPQE